MALAEGWWEIIKFLYELKNPQINLEMGKKELYICFPFPTLKHHQQRLLHILFISLLKFDKHENYRNRIHYSRWS